MKKLLSVLCASALLLSAAAFAAAPSAGDAPIEEFQPPQVCTVPSFTELGISTTSNGSAYTYRFELPADGDFHEMAVLDGTFPAGSTVEIGGVWSPVYAGMTVELRDLEHGGAVGSSLFESNSTITLTTTETSSLGVYVRSERFPVTGILQVTVYP